MRPRPNTSESPDSTASLSAILNTEKWSAVAKELRLTPRQADVVRLVLQAKQNKEIAATLGLQTSTVRMHLRYTFVRLGVTDRMELALRILPLLYGQSFPCDPANRIRSHGRSRSKNSR